MPLQDANPTPSFGGFGLRKPPSSSVSANEAVQGKSSGRLGRLAQFPATPSDASSRRPSTGSSSAWPIMFHEDGRLSVSKYDDMEPGYLRMAIQVMAHNLARWTARTGLGEQVVTTKTLRRRFFSLAGRITRSARRLTLHLPQRWPWETQFSRALSRLRAIPLPT